MLELSDFSKSNFNGFLQDKMLKKLVFKQMQSFQEIK